MLPDRIEAGNDYTATTNLLLMAAIVDRTRHLRSGHSVFRWSAR